MGIIDRLSSVLRPKRSAANPDAALRSFRLQYLSFKDLLHSNAELGSIMADISEKIQGTALFGMSEIRAMATRAVFHTMRMVTALNEISANNYPQFPQIVDDIHARIAAILDSRSTPHNAVLTIPLSLVDKSHIDMVGGKCANLGELRNKAGIITPNGFAITTFTCTSFLNISEVRDEILKCLRDARPEEPATVTAVALKISEIIHAVHVPPAIMDALRDAWDDSFPSPSSVRAALRSSAVGEDGILSFAGQYRTVLGVTRSNLERSFREVLASLFSPRAITYRLHHGIPFEQCLMGMACIEMVDAKSSGIIFSRHPVKPFSDEIVLNSIWGLGAYAVDGIIEPDTWCISPGPPPRVVQQTVADKAVRLVADDCGKHEEAVPDELRRSPSLTEEQALMLADIALHLERHYRHPQDIEWAVNQDGEIVILQSRPMRLPTAANASLASPVIPADIEPLLTNADIACAGVAAGKVFHAAQLTDLADFPDGGVLVAPHSLPNYAMIMGRARAIVTEAGSITGHMASLAREFGIPTLLNAKLATLLLAHGRTVTVDALTGRVYAGEIEEVLASYSPRRFTIAESPVHAALRQVADQIIPLHLLDPKSPLFRPESCTTLHDVMRFVHERCYTEMFRISDRASDAGAVSRQLKAKLPIDLHVIDLGGGLDHVDGPYIFPDQIRSFPLNALLAGMLRPDVHVRGPRPVDMGGFFSVMSQHLLEPPNVQAERFGERSYCIVSDKYLNFSSRVGYHYSVVDAYCDQNMTKNYITFQFKGGAADEIRRGRRVRCIALILERLGFTTEVRGDMTQARFQKYPMDETATRLDQLGRLLVVTRQMDMLMTSDAAVTLMAENFMAGRYH